MKNTLSLLITMLPAIVFAQCPGPTTSSAKGDAVGGLSVLRYGHGHRFSRSRKLSPQNL
jgi:hypothetical protein